MLWAEEVIELPKMKTHSGAKKRFKLSGTGKLMRRRANNGHFKIKKKGARGRRLAMMDQVAKADERKVRRMLGV